MTMFETEFHDSSDDKLPFLKRLTRDLFGEGLPIQQREPVPPSKSEKLLAYAGALFLIAVAAFIPLRAMNDLAYLEDRKNKMLEECVIETGRFNWCWKHLTK